MVMPSSLRQLVVAHFLTSRSTTGGIPPRRGIRVIAMVRRMRKQPKLVICGTRISRSPRATSCALDEGRIARQVLGALE